MRWTRVIPFEVETVGGSAVRSESWRWENGDGAANSFEVEVTLGKPFDVRRIKGIDLEACRAQAAVLRAAAAELYGPRGELGLITACPCCDAPARRHQPIASINEASYRRCAMCGHVFVSPQPPTERLTQLFAQSADHAAAYIDRSAAEARIEHIVMPKLDWTLRAFERACGRSATKLLDVGAGGGHFVEGSRRRGLHADGIEISDASRRFAHDAFGLDLCDRGFDARRSGVGGFDIITMWGLLEYVPEPMRMLHTACELLRPGRGMLVVEVPRFDCVSTASQRQPGATIFRHLDPTSHVNCFTDSSISTALVRAGFEPIAAWYFGMDAYELLMQLSLRMKSTAPIEAGSEVLDLVQQALDRNLVCDDLVIAAVPSAGRSAGIRAGNAAGDS